MDRRPRWIAPNDGSHPLSSHSATNPGSSTDIPPIIRFIPYTGPEPGAASHEPTSAPPTRFGRFMPPAMPPPARPAARIPARIPARPVASQQRLQDNKNDLIVISSDEDDKDCIAMPKGRTKEDAIRLDDEDEDEDIDILGLSPPPSREEPAIQNDMPTTTQEEVVQAVPMTRQSSDTPDAMLDRKLVDEQAAAVPCAEEDDAGEPETSPIVDRKLVHKRMAAAAPCSMKAGDEEQEQQIPDNPDDTMSGSEDSFTYQMFGSSGSSGGSRSLDPATENAVDGTEAGMVTIQQANDIQQLTTNPALNVEEGFCSSSSSTITEPDTIMHRTVTQHNDDEETDTDTVLSSELLFDAPAAMPPADESQVDLLCALNAPDLDDDDEPDWRLLADLTIHDDTTSPDLSAALALAVNTDIPTDKYSILERLSQLDAYETSLESLTSSSSTTSTLQGRPSPVRRRGPSVRYGQKRRKISSSDSGIDSGSSNSSSEPQLRPYVPGNMWPQTTWEDWAQFEVGDWLHWPFEPWEVAVIQQGLEALGRHKRAAKDIRPQIWSILAEQLPGRRPTDCHRFWRDRELGVIQPFDRPVVIGKGKGPSRHTGLYDMVQNAKINHRFRAATAKTAMWPHLEHTYTFGEGSADSIAVQIIKSRRQRGIKVVVASACNDQPEYNMPGNLRLWSADSKKVTQLPYHRTDVQLTDDTEQRIWHTVTDVRLSNDQRFIYSASHDNTARVWDSRSGKLLSTLVFHEKPIHQLAVHPDKTENIVGSASADGTAVVWRLSSSGNVGSGTVCDMSTSEFASQVNNKVSAETLTFGTAASSGKLFTGIMTGLEDPAGFIQVFDASTGNGVMQLTSMSRAVCDLDVSSTGKYIASGNYGGIIEGLTGDGFIHIHDLRVPDTVIKARTGHGDVNVVRMSPCERYVASGNPENETAVLDLRKPTEPLFRLRHERKTESRLVPINSDMGIAGVYWMANTRYMVTAGGDASVKLWDIWGNGKMLRSYDTSSNVTSLAVDEDSMIICAGVSGAQGIVHVWSAAPL